MKIATQEEVIQVPIKRIANGKEFYDSDLSQALLDCQSQNYEAQFMPSIINTRIETPEDKRIWKTRWSSLSIRATGKTKQGNAVVVYAHIPNYFSEPENIRKARKKGLKKGAGAIPGGEFQKLLDLEDGENVFVINYNSLKNSLNGVISLERALKHPQTIPFCGGKEKTEKYLDRHEKVYGNYIGVWHSDDLAEVPFGCLLFVGDDHIDGLIGSDLSRVGRFVGIA